LKILKGNSRNTGLALYVMVVLLLSATLVHLNNGSTSISVYGDKGNDNNNDNDNNNNNKVKNRSTIKDISDQVVSSGVGIDKEQVQQVLQLIQTQIAQTSGQDKATNAIKQIKSVIELNPNGPLAQSLLYLSKQQAIGNINSVNDATVQVAVHLANGSEDLGQIINQAASHTEQVISSQSPSSSSSSLSSSSSSSPSSSSLQLSTAQSPSPSPSPSPPPQAPHLLADNNSPPIADAGHSRPDQTVNEGSLVTLDGSASHDPDGDPITFAWTQMSGPSVQLSSANQAKTSFTAPSNLQADTTISFKLTVTDSSGLSNFDTVSILVRHTATPPPPPTETAPIAVVGPDQTLNESSVVTLDGSASHDPDGDPITFAWDQTSGPPVQLSNPNQAKTNFTAPSNLQEDATMFFKLTVTDKTGLSDSMVQKITVKRSTSPPPPPENGTEQIYTAKPGGRVLTKMNPSGGNCKSDGIRFNIANQRDLVDRESTWIFTLNNDPKSCTDKPWWSPKIGSHGSTGEGSGLYEASVPYSGGFKSMRTEGPHPQYHSCSGYTHGDVPAMPKGKPIGVKGVSWKIPGGVHVEFWYDFTGGGKGPWKKYASLDDTGSGKCGIKPIGADGEITGPAKAQDTMRMNGGSATFISGSIVELAPDQSPRGSIDSSISSSSLSSETDNNAIAVPHPIAKESVFDKGLSDGEKDAKEIAPPPSVMRSDDVDCESPDNMSGQDSIDYCKGYEQGFAEQNNMMAEK
jgi:hypothetical protein